MRDENILNKLIKTCNQNMKKIITCNTKWFFQQNAYYELFKYLKEKLKIQ